MCDLRRYADSSAAESIGNRLRERRFKRFEGLLARMSRPITLLDVGGTARFWELRGWAGDTSYQITTLNLEGEPQVHGNITPVIGDATDMSRYSNRAFDVVFSNSVIEHLYSFERQAAMAREVRRVGRSYWVQTPNYWFPIEPHFHVPGWQWLPEGLRVALIRQRRCGWRGPCPDWEEARRAVREIVTLHPSAEFFEISVK